MRSSLPRWQNGRVPLGIGLRYQGGRQSLTVARRRYAAVASLEELAAAGQNGKPAGKVTGRAVSCVNALTLTSQCESGHGTMK